jgi:hypothetical protein
VFSKLVAIEFQQSPYIAEGATLYLPQSSTSLEQKCRCSLLLRQLCFSSFPRALRCCTSEFGLHFGLHLVRSSPAWL